MIFKERFIALCCLATSLAAQASIGPDILKEVQSVVSSSEAIIKKSREISHSLVEDEITLFSKESLIKKEQCQAGNCAGFQDTASGLMVFVSSSLPFSNLREHSHYLERLGGKFIMRGLPNNNFMSFLNFLKECKKNKVIAPVEIDPDLYKKYGIQAVPTIVLDNGEKFDKVSGNITIRKALEIFSERGDTSSLARQLTFEYKQAKASEVLHEK